MLAARTQEMNHVAVVRDEFAQLPYHFLFFCLGGAANTPQDITRSRSRGCPHNDCVPSSNEFAEQCDLLEGRRHAVPVGGDKGANPPAPTKNSYAKACYFKFKAGFNSEVIRIALSEHRKLDPIAGYGPSGIGSSGCAAVQEERRVLGTSARSSSHSVLPKARRSHQWPRR